MKTHKNFFLLIFLIICMSGLLLSNRHAHTEEKQQTGREKIMSETPTPCQFLGSGLEIFHFGFEDSPRALLFQYQRIMPGTPPVFNEYNEE